MCDIENPMLSPRRTDDLKTKPIVECYYRNCDELIHPNEGIEFNGYIYCSTSCIGDELLKEGHAVDLSK